MSIECDKSPTGNHEVDLTTCKVGFLQRGQQDAECDTVYIDCKCRHCGWEGCISKITEESEVDW